MTLPRAATEILESGKLCYLAAPGAPAPHLTPVVFVLHGGRVWATTSRGTVKARAWRRDPRAGGVVRVGDRAVTFRGLVTLYDALDPFTWPVSVLRGTALTRASTKFTVKNVRFFTGYARDAFRVPLSWTPPGRVVVSVDLDAGAVLDTAEGGIVERWGEWRSAVSGRRAYRAAAPSAFRDQDLSEEVLDLLEPSGEGVLGIDGPGGLAVLPSTWTRSEGAYFAVLPRPALALSGAGPEGTVSLVVDRASVWRAARMAGVLLRGPADVFVPQELTRGRQALVAVSGGAGQMPGDPAVVRLRPETAVWWKGWTSGTVKLG